MKNKIIFILVVLLLLCSCSITDKDIETNKPAEEEIPVLKAEVDYSNLHELTRLYEKYALGINLDPYVPGFFAMGMLHEYGKDEEFIKDNIFSMPYEQIYDFAPLFFSDDVIIEKENITYAGYLDQYKDIILEPFEINDSVEDISVLYGRFIADEDGIRHWLYPVIYTVEPCYLTEDEIPAVLADKIKAGEQRFRIKNIENIKDLENAKKIYTENGYGDLFAQKTYEISSPDDILAMSERVNSEVYNEMNASYTLTKDIDMSNAEFTPIGISKSYMSYLDERNPNNMGFTGTFEGNNFTISNLNCVGKSSESNEMGEYLGFFSVLGNGAHVNNLNIENANIVYENNFYNVSSGILAGRMLSAIVENCYVSGSVKGIGNVGGLVGETTYDYKTDDSSLCSEIINCKANVEVYGEDWVGGLIGSNHRTIVTNSSVSGIVTCDKIYDDVDMPMGIGGFAGHNVWADIRNCGADVWVKTMVDSRCVGSFVGLNEGDIYECFYNSTTSNWKPSGDTPIDESQNDIADIPEDEYYKRLSEMY
ncbi:GLUG motif-containing protein [Sedimentibacter saalensis]|nr:GLUG motif-containing protein [Sedimentibacter saalensis]